MRALYHPKCTLPPRKPCPLTPGVNYMLYLYCVLVPLALPLSSTVEDFH